MARKTLSDIPAEFRQFHRIENGADVFEFRGIDSMFRLLAHMQSIDHDANTGGDLEWSGVIHEQTRVAYAANRGAQKALDDFRKAQAAFPLHGAPSRPVARPCGGAWVIPEVIKGSPLPARVRPRTALPIRDFRLHMSISAYVEFEVIAVSAAKVARAAWEYTLQGGIVQCTAIYENGYHTESKHGTNACVIILHPSLASEWEIAQSISIQTYRAVAIRLARAFSGTRDDSLRVSRLFAGSNVAALTGDAERDAKELRKFDIE